MLKLFGLTHRVGKFIASPGTFVCWLSNEASFKWSIFKIRRICKKYQ